MEFSIHQDEEEGGKHSKPARGGVLPKPLRQAADPLKDLSPQQLLRKARDLIKLKDNQMKKITLLEAENKIIKEQSNDKDRKIKSMAREHSKMMQEEIISKDARIQAMTELHSSEIAK